MSGPERTSEPPRTTPTYQGPERNGSAVRITVETIQLDRPVKTISVAVSQAAILAACPEKGGAG